MREGVSISRDPDHRWAGKRTMSFQATDRAGPLVVVVDDDDWGAIVEEHMPENALSDDVPEAAFLELEQNASSREISLLDGARVIDLRTRL